MHIDIWGPFSLISVEGYKYFLTIIDDHTRFTWVYLLRKKSDVSTIFPTFYELIFTQFNLHIKSVRSANAPELNFVEYFKTKGIIHYHSCVERPQQNSVVERKHQHILNVARALLFQSNVPLVYWSDCILTAVYVINRTPSSILWNKTPFDILYCKPPLYAHLKVFGCLCYGSTLLSSRHKFSPRAIKSVFLGYPPSYKGYKLLDLDTNETYISRDVVFHESVFPFKAIKELLPHDFFSDRFLPSHVSLSLPLTPRMLQHVLNDLSLDQIIFVIIIVFLLPLLLKILLLILFIQSLVQQGFLLLFMRLLIIFLISLSPILFPGLL